MCILEGHWLSAAITIILKGCEVTFGRNVESFLHPEWKQQLMTIDRKLVFKNTGKSTIALIHCWWASVEHWKSNDITTKGSTEKWFSKSTTYVQHFTSVLGQLSHYYLGIDEIDGLISEHINRGIDGQLNNKNHIDTHYLQYTFGKQSRWSHLQRTITGYMGIVLYPFRTHTHAQKKNIVNHCNPDQRLHFHVFGRYKGGSWHGDPQNHAFQYQTGRILDSEGTPHCRKLAYIIKNVRDASLDLPTTTPFAHETEVSNPDRRVTSDALSRASSDRYVVHRALGTARRDGRCDASQWLEYTVQTQKYCGLAKFCHMICIILPNTWPKEHTSTCKNNSGPNKYMKQMNTSVLSATVLYAHAWVAVCRDSPLFPQLP